MNVHDGVVGTGVSQHSHEIFPLHGVGPVSYTHLVIVKAVRPKTKLTREGFQTQVPGTILSDAGMVAEIGRAHV